MAPLTAYDTVGDLAVTRDLAQRIISLPLANDLTDEEIRRIRSVLVPPAEERRSDPRLT